VPEKFILCGRVGSLTTICLGGEGGLAGRVEADGGGGVGSEDAFIALGAGEVGELFPLADKLCLA
jgi:hypothetical protein